MVGRIDVSGWEHVRVEPRGATKKEWLRHPEASSNDPASDWLFKAVVDHADGSRQAGDFTEVIAARVASHLGLPVAETELARRDRVDGVIVRNVQPIGFDMITGRLAMLDALGVTARGSDRDRTATRGHSLDNVIETLAEYDVPPGAVSWDGCSAQDVMVAYLLLDALIGNTDRHEHNWSVLRNRDPSGRDHLAALYDLGASMGFQLTDERRASILSAPEGISRFVERGRAGRFDGDRRTTLLDLAVHASHRCSSTGRDRLLAMVDSIASMDLDSGVLDLDGMSEVARTFASAVLSTNRGRISHAPWT